MYVLVNLNLASEANSELPEYSFHMKFYICLCVCVCVLHMCVYN